MARGITAVYQPFTLQERMAPLQMMKEERDKISDAIATLGEQATEWENYITPNSQAAQKLKEYKDTLDNVASEMSANGLKAVSRNTLFNLKRQYSNEIAPINKAAKSLAEMYDSYRKVAMADPTFMIGAMPTIDEYIANPQALPVSVSGTALYKEGVAAGSSMPLDGSVDPATFIQSIAAKYNLGSLQDPQKAINFIANGVRDAVGAREVAMNEYQQKLDMQAQKEIQAYKAKHAYTGGGSGKGVTIMGSKPIDWIKAGYDPTRIDENTGLPVYDKDIAARSAKQARATSGVSNKNTQTIIYEQDKNGNINSTVAKNLAEAQMPSKVKRVATMSANQIINAGLNPNLLGQLASHAGAEADALGNSAVANDDTLGGYVFRVGYDSDNNIIAVIPVPMKPEKSNTSATPVTSGDTSQEDSVSDNIVFE